MPELSANVVTRGDAQREGTVQINIDPSAAAAREAAQQAVTVARRALDDARFDLQQIEASTGVGLPLAEVLFFKTLPTQVQHVDVKRGDIVAGMPVMTVSGAQVTIESMTSRWASSLTERLPSSRPRTAV